MSSRAPNVNTRSGRSLRGGSRKDSLDMAMIIGQRSRLSSHRTRNTFGTPSSPCDLPRRLMARYPLSLESTVSAGTTRSKALGQSSHTFFNKPVAIVISDSRMDWLSRR